LKIIEVKVDGAVPDKFGGVENIRFGEKLNLEEAGPAFLYKSKIKNANVFWNLIFIFLIRELLIKFPQSISISYPAYPN